MVLNIEKAVDICCHFVDVFFLFVGKVWEEESN
jgi:hypothetical protein